LQVFGKPIGKNQAVQFPIADAYIQTRAAELMVQKVADSMYTQGITLTLNLNLNPTLTEGRFNV